MSKMTSIDFDYEEIMIVKNAVQEIEESLKTIKTILDKYGLTYFKRNPKNCIDEIVLYLETNMDLENCELPKEYGYSCLPLCLIDAIYSIGVHYTSTQRTVAKYCKYFDIEQFEKDRHDKPEHRISDLIKNIKDENNFEPFAKDVLENMQRTSSRNGVLKIQAVYECAKILKEAKIETKEDFLKKFDDNIEKKFKLVKGQKSGISLAYLKMLCGDENKIKPDRHVLRFLEKFYYDVTLENVEEIIKDVINQLTKKHENITPRKLDYMIWEHMRSKV